mmetsp:Transcript_22556/g.54510  ORF Transcript_22556/g.54510 Transcript_22556/m.54510 type:complete len:126 (-) Transcript_22556:53-430(-)
MNDEIAPARARLRKVGDPDTVEKRIEKRSKIKTEQSKKPKGPLGLSAELLQTSREVLRKDPNANLASYLKHRKENNDRSIDDGLKELDTPLEEDIKAHDELVSIFENNKLDVDVPSENGNKCTIS